MNPPYRYGRGEAVSDQTAAGGRPPAGPAVPAMECVAPDRMFVIGRVPERRLMVADTAQPMRATVLGRASLRFTSRVSLCWSCSRNEAFWIRHFRSDPEYRRDRLRTVLH